MRYLLRVDIDENSVWALLFNSNAYEPVTYVVKYIGECDFLPFLFDIETVAFEVLDQ
jgi:hypothetical protein